MYVLEAGAALGDPPLSIFYSGKDSQLWRFEGNVMVDRRGLVLEFTGQDGRGNFIMAEKSGAEDQKFNIDGFMFQSMVNTYAIDIPGFNGKDAAIVFLHPQHGGTNQLWNVINVLLSKECRNNTVKPLGSLIESLHVQNAIFPSSTMVSMSTTVWWNQRMTTGALLPLI